MVQQTRVTKNFNHLAQLNRHVRINHILEQNEGTWFKFIWKTTNGTIMAV